MDLVAPSNTSLSEIAYQEIKKAIITHRLTPEMRISEALLSNDFSLGKTPIRNAVARLVEEGLIISKSAKTQVVAPLTFASVREIHQLRSLLEPEAARLAAGRVDRAELNKLNAACRKTYTYGAADEEYAFLVANKMFHLAIAKATGNDRLYRWIENLQDAAMRVLWVVLQIDNRPKVWGDGHEDLIEALCEGNRDAAADKARRHLANNHQLTLDILIEAPEIRDTRLASAVAGQTKSR